VRKVLVLAGVAAVAAALAAPASADTRHCYSVHSGNLPVVGQLNTTEQCISLPIEPTS
jgi:hypothetical protein